jgi:hypothetical protein
MSVGFEICIIILGAAWVAKEWISLFLQIAILKQENPETEPPEGMYS